MKKLMLIALAACALSFVPVKAHAVEQDMAKITCKDFLAEKEGIPMMVMWIDGYLSGKSDNTVLNDAWMEKLGLHLGQYCAKNPAKTIMDAIDAMPSN